MLTKSKVFLATSERPVVRFSSAELSPEDQFEAYRNLYAGGTDAIRIGPQFSARLEARPLGEIIVFERWLNHVAHDRTMGRVRQDGFEHFVIQANLSGVLVAHTPDHVAQVKPGDVVIFDTRRAYRTECENAHILTFSVARYVVERAFVGADELHGRVLAYPHCALLSDFMVSLNRHAASLSELALTTMMDVFSEMLAISLRAVDKTQLLNVSASSKLASAQRVIEEELPQRDLEPDLIAKRIGVSRSRLYELFKPLGGVAHYIQLRRVHRFRALLSQSRDVRSMAEMAFACGFASESHASRSFREVFAMPPGQFRRRQSEPAGEPATQLASRMGGFDPWVSSLTRRQHAAHS